MKARLFSALALAIVLPYTVAPRASARQRLDEHWSALEENWRAALNESGVVGGSVMLLRKGDILRTAYEGLADRESNRRVDGRTIYHWASITKTLTGIAVMQLRDRGLIRLDDAIVDYIPELRVVHNPYGDMRRITLRHLMSHAAGFRNPTWPWSDESWQPHEPTAWSQIVAMLPYTEILFEPGSRYSYSNLGIILLGQVIERVTGEDYEVYVEKNILRPLGMRRSYFDATPLHLLPYRSNNYSVFDGRATANGLDFDTGVTVSNSGLNAPLGDMARYLAFLSGAREDEPHASGVLSRSSLEEMWTPLQTVSEDDEARWSLGLNFFIREKDGRKVIGHTGSQKGFRSFIYLDTETGAACIAAYNTSVRTRNEDGDLVSDDTGFSETRHLFLDDIFPLFER